LRLAGGQVIAGTDRDRAREYEDLTTVTRPAIVWLVRRIGGAPVAISTVIMPGSTRIVPPPRAPIVIRFPRLDDEGDDNDDHGIEIRNTRVAAAATVSMLPLEIRTVYSRHSSSTSRWIPHTTPQPVRIILVVAAATILTESLLAAVGEDDDDDDDDDDDNDDHGFELRNTVSTLPLLSAS